MNLSRTFSQTSTAWGVQMANRRRMPATSADHGAGAVHNELFLTALPENPVNRRELKE